MDFRTLGTDFLPDQLVEGYKSLIWTERFATAGDFELVTADIERTMALLPIGSMVECRQGNDCKFVETHSIETNTETQETTLTVTGRSFETFFENRVVHEGAVRMFTLDGDPEGGGGGNPPPYAWNLATTGEAASKYAYEMITYICQKITTNGEVIPNLSVSVDPNAVLGPMPRRYMTVQLGNLYERLLEVLAMDDLGIRSILPTGTGTNITIYIYAGTDVSNTVQLNVADGHFTKTAYLWSNRNYKNGAQAFSQWDWSVRTNVSASGLNRRFGFVDAKDITHPSYTLNSNVDEKELQGRMASYLGKHKKTTAFSGEVSPDIPYKYMTDYKLGDIVQVLGDYRVNQKMRVTEFTRIEDENGERAFPTLEAP